MLALPAMAAQLVNVLYNIVDRIYVGNMPVIGSDALIGIGVCAPITTLISSFAFLIGLGGAPLFSISLGEQNEERAKKILSNAFLMLLILSALLMIIFYSFLTPMLYAFGASAKSFPYARAYMLIYLSGTFFSIVSLGLNQFLTAQGESFLAMLTTLAACLFNIALDPLFMYVLNMGIYGAALATVICQFISFSLVILLLLFKSKIRLSFSKPDLAIIRKTLKLGFSPFIIIVTDSIVLIILNSTLQKYGGEDGDFYIEVNTIVQAFQSLITGPLLGISSGTQPILGYNYGAKNISLIKKAEKQIVICGLAFTSICFVLSYFVSEPFSRMFIALSSSSQNTEEVIQTSVKYIGLYMYGIIPLSLQYVFVDGLTGMGQANYSIWLSLNRKVFLLIPLTLILPYITKSAPSAFYAELTADVISGLVSTAVYMIITPKILKRRAESPLLS